MDYCVRTACGRADHNCVTYSVQSRSCRMCILHTQQAGKDTDTESVTPLQSRVRSVPASDAILQDLDTGAVTQKWERAWHDFTYNSGIHQHCLRCTARALQPFAAGHTSEQPDTCSIRTPPLVISPAHMWGHTRERSS